MQHAENTIATDPYDEAKVPQWIATITEKVMNDLVELNKPFKYVGEQLCFVALLLITIPAVSVLIMEQTGGGINTANSAYWDSIRDGAAPTHSHECGLMDACTHCAGCKVAVWPPDKKKNECVSGVPCCPP